MIVHPFFDGLDEKCRRWPKEDLGFMLVLFHSPFLYVNARFALDFKEG